MQPESGSMKCKRGVSGGIPDRLTDGLLTGLCSALVLLLGGCASAVVDLSGYREVPMASADVMPSPEQVQARRTKVVVLEVDDRAVRSRMGDAGALKQRKLEDVLTEGGVEIIDRQLAGTLRQEIALAESRGDGQSSYTGPEVAQFAIRGFINDVGASSNYNAPSQFCDKKGKCTYVPASCNYSGTASGALRVYELPSLRLINTFNLKGNATSSTDGGCYSSPGQLAGVARAALEDAVHDSRFDLHNFFAPKGYVSEKRIQDKKAVFKVLMGRQNGLKPEDPVVFYTVQQSENRLTRKVERTEIQVATGVVSNMVGEDFAWVIPNASDKPEAIRLGDYVRLQRRKGWFD